MTRLTPCIFASMIRSAQGFRAQGDASYQACAQACHTHGVDDAWASVLCAFLNDSPTIAEQWAERVTQSALDRAYAAATEYTR
jgi:hypothetical protein